MIVVIHQCINCEFYPIGGNYEMLQRGSTVTYDDQDLSNHSPEEVKGYFKVHHIQVKPFDA
ncbi:3198_t:CDS:2, partial [Entrophospora sp. SA101]